jgi:catechol 2,3-dioxygenase-like lactoylglutathione lyase family enzyme
VTARVDLVTLDCADPEREAIFWSDALGYRVGERAGSYVFVEDPSGRAVTLVFQRVPEDKRGKNRVHLDLRPSASIAREVERFVGLGASVIGEVHELDRFWTVMSDPEGNEFCVLRGPEDGWAPGPAVHEEPGR